MANERGGINRWQLLSLFLIVIIFLMILLWWRNSSRHGPGFILANPFATPFAVVLGRDSCLELEKWSIVRAPVLSKSANPWTRRTGKGLCVYKWRGRDLPTREDFAKINAVPDNVAVAASSAEAAAPAISANGDKRSTFDSRVRGMSQEAWKSFALERMQGTKRPVRVAVVDATPFGTQKEDRSGHGFAVSRVIGTLLCRDVNSKECGDQIRPYLALPVIGEVAGDFSEDPVNGGRAGTFSQILGGLQAALDDWDPRQQNLVINLSIGWDPIVHDPGNPIIQEILTELRRASCMGALVVAAAGNYTGSEGPIYPGAYESNAAPSEQECKDSGLLEQGAQGNGSAEKKGDASLPRNVRPLVASAGAVNAQDQRTSTSRHWGFPRLAALGVGVAVPGLPGQVDPEPRSGSSMSSAIVSAIAAVVWSLRPDLDARGVMEVVYKSGFELDGGTKSNKARTEFCVDQPDGPCDGRDMKVRRVSLCQSINLAQPGQNIQCEGAPTIPAVPKPAMTSLPSGIKGECSVTNCGIPLGPASAQLSLAVLPHTGVASCPGCSFRFTPSGSQFNLRLTGGPTRGSGKALAVTVTIGGKPFAVPDLTKFGDTLDSLNVIPSQYDLSGNAGTIWFNYTRSGYGGIGTQLASDPVDIPQPPP